MEPKTTNKYQRGNVDLITNLNYDLIYYGSTCQPLANRIADHRQKYKSHTDGKRGKVCVFDIFDAFGVENCKIELVEDYPCETKEQLLSREGHYIRNNDCVNKHQVGRTGAQYYLDNKEKIRERVKEYKQKTETRYWRGTGSTRRRTKR